MSHSYNGFDASEFTEWVQDFLGDEDEEAQMYRSASGEQILMLSSFANRQFDDEKYLRNSLFAVSHDGKTFRQMEGGSYSGSSDKHTSSYEDPATQKYYRMFFEGGIHTRFELDSRDLPLQEYTYEGFEHFISMNVDIPEDALFVPVPEVRMSEYLFRFKDGTYLYIDAAKYGYAYEHLRLFIGTPDEMIQEPITDFSRYRDGGTTIIHTPKGVLFSPTSFDENGVPFWSENIGLNASEFFNGEIDSTNKLVRLDRAGEENIALIQSFVLKTL